MTSGDKGSVAFDTANVVTRDSAMCLKRRRAGTVTERDLVLSMHVHHTCLQDNPSVS